jgi:hypothetical protein
VAQVQAAIEKPLPRGPAEVVGESAASKRTAAVLGNLAPDRSGGKYSSIVESIPPAAEETKRAGGSDEDDIVDEVGDGGQIEESIRDSLPYADDSSKQLGHMRAVIGSEQSIKDMSQGIVDGRQPVKSVGPFNKSTFQDYKADKFKSMLVAEQADGMTQYMSEIERAVVTK